MLTTRNLPSVVKTNSLGVKLAKIILATRNINQALTAALLSYKTEVTQIRRKKATIY